MVVCELHFTEPSQSYFWQTFLIFQECAQSLCYFLHASKCCMLPRPRSLTMFPSLYLFYSLSGFLPHCELHTRSQAGRKSTRTFSLNTHNLNSLLIRRYVTSLTLPSSPSFSPPILCSHPRLLHSSLSPNPPYMFLPSPFIFTCSSSLSLSFLPFSLFSSQCLPLQRNL